MLNKKNRRQYFNLMKMNETQTLKLAHDFMKVAEKHAKFKRTEGYIEDNYSFFQILNLDACMDICDKGPADFYYEKAYELLCKELGVDHPETRKLVQEIINYHVNNVKRMMCERFFLPALIMLPILWLLIRELFGVTWQGIIAMVSCYALLYLFWNLETYLLCFLEKRKRQMQYRTITIKTK